LSAECLDRCLASPAAGDRLLAQLAGELGLKRIELLVTAIAAGGGTELMCGRAVAHLQAPVGGSRPTLCLLAAVLAQFADGGDVIASILNGAGVASGLLQVLNEGAPLAERAVAVPVPLSLALDGEETGGDGVTWPGTVLGRTGYRDVPLPPST